MLSSSDLGASNVDDQTSDNTPTVRVSLNITSTDGTATVVGDTVKVGANQGVVEDIGLRSTKIRTPGRSLIVIPNRSVAGEAITNLTRMPQRRVDQTLGLTYDTTPEQMQALLERSEERRVGKRV